MQYLNLSDAVHELEHGYQHMKGKILLSQNPDDTKYVDEIDEIEAYRMQYFFNPRSVKKLESSRPDGPKIGPVRSYRDITGEWVRYLRRWNSYVKDYDYIYQPFIDNNRRESINNPNK